MAKTVKIPDNMRPWKAIINGIEYVYPAGATQEVPDEVADFIERISKVEPEKAPVVPPFSGGGGTAPGGVTSWNDLTDKPFGETESRTTLMSDYDASLSGYGVELTTEIIAPNDTYLYEVLKNVVNTGDRITVVYDGVSYDFPTGFEATGQFTEGVETCYLGNRGLERRIDGTLTNPELDNGLPFLIRVVYFQVYLFGQDNANHNVSMYRHTTVVKTLDPKYLPSGGGGVLGVVIKWTDSDGEHQFSCNKTYQEVREALDNNRPVVAILAENTGVNPPNQTMYGHCYLYGDSGIVFSGGMTEFHTMLTADNVVIRYSDE